MFSLFKFDECIINADKVLAIDPKNIDLLVTKIRALFSLRKYEDCNIIADSALAIDPNYQYALEIKNYLKNI